jgi:hypothetical protein
MDDELNMDPRETDYMDDYDMDKAMNFFELEKQLAELGFNDPELIHQLRKKIMGDDLGLFTINCRAQEQGNELRTWFEYEQIKGNYLLKHYETLFSIGNQEIHRLFQPDIKREAALAVLYKDQREGHDVWAEQKAIDQIHGYILPRNFK